MIWTCRRLLEWEWEGRGKKGQEREGMNEKSDGRKGEDRQTREAKKEEGVKLKRGSFDGGRRSRRSFGRPLGNNWSPDLKGKFTF